MFEQKLEELFRKYKNDIFIETGTFRGNGIQIALNAEYKNIFSIEIEKCLYDAVKNKFGCNVKIYNGSSLEILPNILEDINTRVTFWLDAHFGPNTNDVNKCVPLLKELEIIGKHKIKNHTIIIDDVTQFGKHIIWSKITMENVTNSIKNINSNYEIELIDIKSDRKNDILVAFCE